MTDMHLILGNRKSVFDLAGEVYAQVRRSPYEYALVVRPNGRAALLSTSSRSTQIIAHEHPEQIAGLFSNVHSVSVIRRDIQAWVDAGGHQQKLAPIELVPRAKGMWRGSMFRDVKPRRSLKSSSSRQRRNDYCPDHCRPIPLEQNDYGRLERGRCPQCVEENRAAIERMKARQ